MALGLAKCVLYTIFLCVHWRKIEGWEEVGQQVRARAGPIPIKYVLPSFFLFIAFLFFFPSEKT